MTQVPHLKEKLDTLREAGVSQARFSETGALLEVTFGTPAGDPSEPEQQQERRSPLKKSARALLAPMPREGSDA